MNATGEAILTHPHPCGHIVYPYTNESQFVDAVCLFAGTGLREGDSALLIMQQSHCEPILRQLRETGFDVNELEASGRLACESAEDLLATFFFDGIIDEHEFKTRAGRLIERAKAASSTDQVRVFGEMVNLLWISDPKATQRLEELWNEVIKVHSVPLLCAYGLDHAHAQTHALPDTLLECHSEALV